MKWHMKYYILLYSSARVGINAIGIMAAREEIAVQWPKMRAAKSKWKSTNQNNNISTRYNENSNESALVKFYWQRAAWGCAGALALLCIMKRK